MELFSVQRKNKKIIAEQQKPINKMHANTSLDTSKKNESIQIINQNDKLEKIENKDLYDFAKQNNILVCFVFFNFRKKIF